MSRLTSAQVINLGEYLESDFDPCTLTVSQLLGILGFHNIRYPAPYTKGKLIQLFNDEIKTRAAKFKRERTKKENSQASDDGIMDGITGEPLNGKGKSKLMRRSSRRLSGQTLKTEEETPPTRPEPAKRRRSSAQPTLGRTSRRAGVVPTDVTLVEESEPDENDLPVRKVGRPKKTTTAGKQARRISHVSGEESGWEDNNIFQSGAESSSPVRPSPIKPRASKTSVGPRKSRKSMSAPPQMSGPSSPLQPPGTVVSPPQSPFQPSIPSFPELKFTPSRSRMTPISDFRPTEASKHPAGSFQIDDKISELTEPSQESAEVKTEGDQNLEHLSTVLTDEMSASSELYQPSARQIWARLVAWLLIVASAYVIGTFKVESASIGFCERGQNTNSALQLILERRSAAATCNREGRPFLYNSRTEEPCPLPPLIPIPEPSSCTPCPEHASCSQHNVTCDVGHLLKPNIFLSFIPVLPSQSKLTTQYAPWLSNFLFRGVSYLTDGLPLFGSVGFPPRCIEDPKRKKNIGNLGKAIEARLAKERGRRVCRGDRPDLSQADDSTDSAIKWGVEISKLKGDFKKTATPALLPTFDDMFNEAIQQLTQWGGVFVGETSDGTRYVSHKTPVMSWDCIIIVKSREFWDAWRSTVLVSILIILFALVIRIKMTQKQKESKRIAALVQVALDALRNQELGHYIDPVSAPAPFLSSIQLRDLVLQDEHSLNTRRRLWEKVEAVVESNTNVRINLEEIEGGDELRVWRWIGSTGRTPGRKEPES